MFVVYILKALMGIKVGELKREGDKGKGAGEGMGFEKTNGVEIKGKRKQFGKTASLFNNLYIYTVFGLF